MAEVFLGVQVGRQALDRLVVVKQLPASVDNADEVSRMFPDEAKIIATLNHPNIIQIFDLTHTDDYFNIVMEYVDGESLAYILKSLRTEQKSIPYPVICRLMEQLCEGLQYAHTIRTPLGEPLNIVHRDIDPRNLMINSNGYLKIIDFGVAKASVQTQMTAPGFFKGKLSHLAPDVFTCRNIDYRMDLYSAGLVLFEMITMRKAVQFPSDEPVVVSIQRIIEEPLADLCTIKPNTPRKLANIVVKACHKNREQRYQNADEFAEDIRKFARSMGGMASNAEVKAWFNAQFADRLAERRLFENKVLSLAGKKLSPKLHNLQVDVQAHRSRVRSVPPIDRPTIVARPPKKKPPSEKPMPSFAMEDVLEFPFSILDDDEVTTTTRSRAADGSPSESNRRGTGSFSNGEDDSGMGCQQTPEPSHSGKKIIAAGAVSVGITATVVFGLLMFMKQSDDSKTADAAPAASVADAEVPRPSMSTESSGHAEKRELLQNALTPSGVGQSPGGEIATTVTVSIESKQQGVNPSPAERKADDTLNSSKHTKRKWERRYSRRASGFKMRKDEDSQTSPQSEKGGAKTAPTAAPRPSKAVSSKPIHVPMVDGVPLVESGVAVVQPKVSLVPETKAPQVVPVETGPKSAAKSKLLSGNGYRSGKEAADRGCTQCHRNHGAETKTPGQWEFFFSSNRHRRYKNLEDYFSVQELSRVKSYLILKSKEIERKNAAIKIPIVE